MSGNLLRLSNVGGTIHVMGGSSSHVPSFGAPSGSEERSRPPIVPIAIGVVLVLAVIGLFAFFGRRGTNQNATPGTADPYAANLAIFDVAMSTAANFAGQEVTYIEGKIKNNGNKSVKNVLVQFVFHDSLGQVAQREPGQRLMVITTREPYIDIAPLANAPLHPGQTKEFRQTFEHVSADWNMHLPEITVVRTSTD
ncbi:MAG TPA: DUF2393 family protein [Terriglobales bacterium]|nr:DUF2393 family protein [Terriglobales bacterium]